MLLIFLYFVKTSNINCAQELTIQSIQQSKQEQYHALYALLIHTTIQHMTTCVDIIDKKIAETKNLVLQIKSLACMTESLEWLQTKLLNASELFLLHVNAFFTSFYRKQGNFYPSCTLFCHNNLYNLCNMYNFTVLHEVSVLHYYHISFASVTNRNCDMLVHILKSYHTTTKQTALSLTYHFVNLMHTILIHEYTKLDQTYFYSFPVSNIADLAFANKKTTCLPNNVHIANLCDYVSLLYKNFAIVKQKVLATDYECVLMSANEQLIQTSYEQIYTLCNTYLQKHKNIVNVLVTTFQYILYNNSSTESVSNTKFLDRWIICLVSMLNTYSELIRYHMHKSENRNTAVCRTALQNLYVITKTYNEYLLIVIAKYKSISERVKCSDYKNLRASDYVNVNSRYYNFLYSLVLDPQNANVYKNMLKNDKKS